MTFASVKFAASLTAQMKSKTPDENTFSHLFHPANSQRRPAMNESPCQLSLVQRSDLTRDNWEIIQEQIESQEKHYNQDPMVLAELLNHRDTIEKSLWELEFKISLDLLLTQEAMTALKPFIESAFAAGIRAGATDSFEHFLIVALAGPDGIRPTIQSLAEAQEAIADRLGIPV